MKTSINLSILLTGLFGLTHLTAEAQYSTKLWARVSDSSSTPRILDNGTIGSNNIDFATALNTRGVYQVSQALSHSRIPKLQAVYEFNCNCSSDELETTLRNFPNVISEIERAPVYKTLYTPNDYNAVFSSNYALELIKAPQAWNLTQSNSSIIIGISDENLNPNHEELAGKIVHYDTHNQHETEHGTAVAIIAAGNTDNLVGTSSIGFNSSLAFYQMSYDELIMASHSGIDILNISWYSGCSYSQIEQDVINEIYSNGTFIIAAAGNGTTCGDPNAMAYPASYGNVFSVTSVGAFDSHEQIPGDPNSTHQHNLAVDLAAPGYKVNISDAPDNYLLGSGTSYAAPFVSGTVALMLSVNNCLDNDEIEQILKNSANNIDLANTHYVGIIGAGRLNANAAVIMAMSNHNNLYAVPTVQNGCTDGDGSINITPISGQAPYTVVWNNGMVGLSNNGLNSGSYAIQIIDAHGCTTQTTAVVNNSTPVISGDLINNVNCFGGNDGQVNVFVEEGNPSYTFTWSNGSSNQNIANLPVGTYTLTVSDINGCETSETYDINEPTALTNSVVASADLGNNEGSIDLSVSGGTPSYTFDWSNGQSTEDLNGLNAGIYDVLITDLNGCTQSVIVVIIDEPTATVSTNLDFEMNVYPNPSYGDTKVTWKGEGTELKVYNQMGGLVLSKKISATQTHENFNLGAGMYTIKLSSSSGSIASMPFIVL